MVHVLRIAAFIAIACCSTASLKMFAADGDTIVVKTLQFSDITKRSGTWLFPPPGRYEKVIMQYTLKCDPATKQDKYPCGEWDYLTYNVLRDSTGEFDSTKLAQVNFMVRGATPDSFPYTATFVNNKLRYRTTTTSRAGVEGDFFPVGAGGQNNSAVLRPEGGRARYIWKASELAAAGINAGIIAGIKFTTSAAAPNVQVFTVRMQAQVNATLGKTMSNDNFTTVVRRNLSFVNGVNQIAFSTPFSWDGSSDIIIDLSCYSAPAVVGISSASAADGLSDDGSRNAFRFTAGDRIEIPGEIGLNISDEITISYWCWGDPNKMPRAHNTMEAYDAQGRRVLNIHAPWDNGSVYWDAGIDPADGSVDRIEKLATEESYEGRWNHWAYTKSKTGIMRVYLNGVLFNEGNGKTRKMNGITKFVFGSGGSGSYEGLLDEIQVWNTALDEATIKTWMNKRVTDSHPQYSKLIVYYRGELDTDPTFTRDESIGGYNGQLFGIPTREKISLDQLGHQTGINTSRPFLTFEMGSVPTTTTRVDVDIATAPRRTSVVLFQNPVQPRIYRPGATDHPSIPTDTLLVQEAGKLYTYDEAGLKVDSMVVPTQITLRKVQLPYYDPIVDFEIGRYITPYGIGLDLGPKGFRWAYDVTDFAPLLRNNVTLSAGNQQELIDVTFLFIKGTPPRDVKQIDQIYYDRGAMFPNVLTGTSLPAVDVKLSPLAKTFRLKTITSGHDFSNETNCAEFCPRTHFLSVDGTERFSWLLWKECSTNPVYPQGGTWLIDRTGWCPGAPVDLYEFELTPFTTGKSTVSIDYGIKKQATNEAWGRWEVSTQLIGYSDANFQKDAAVVDIISPNNWEYYGRLNPICGEPIIVIQNTGATTLTSCVIEYTVNGSGKKSYNWTGSLKFLQRDTVVLPQATWPTASGLFGFVASIVLPGDEYASNNARTTQCVMPPSYYSDLQIILRTNKNAEQQYVWKLRKTTGEVIGSGENLASETTFTYDFNLADGCYDFELINKEDLGLDFWYYRNQIGTGSLNFKSGGQTIKTFEPDFGHRAWMQFTVAPKPTIQTNVDSVKWELPAPGREEKTFVIRSVTDSPLRVDSLGIFSVKKHFSVVSTSKPLPATLAKGDSITVTLAFARPDAGNTSGSIRVYCNDERQSAKQVRLLGSVLTTGVEDESIEPSSVVVFDVVPHPVTDAGTVRLQVYRSDLLRDAQIIVRDLVGRQIATIYRGDIAEGEQRFDLPTTIPTGTYVVSVESGLVRQTIQLVITR
ncbi:MAG: peptide-N-glycosidase F-related protein [Candidatus Kapabacteria bacterium]|nr:peptide-N-glycosidase F-related protein [Candidatus Kapabacteria bacterium]